MPIHVDPGGVSTGGPPIGLFIVTPVRLYRDGIALFLHGSPAVTVLGAVAEGPDTVRLAAELLPDVILLDMALDNSCGMARRLQGAVPASAIVGLAVSEAENHVVTCAEAGIAGYISPEGSLDDLLVAVIRAHNREAACSPRVVAELFRHIAHLAAKQPASTAAEPPPVELTPRELQVVGLIDDGMTNQQIARRLQIELATVKNHVHSILEKSGARSRGEAAARARQRPGWSHAEPQARAYS